MRTIREKVLEYDWGRRSLVQLKEELGHLLDREILLPSEPGGWWHQYVCPVHHTELRFEPEEADAKEFHCPHGCRLEGEPYRGAWLVFKHQSLARYALIAAVVHAAEGEDIYAGLAKEILVRYAEQFPEYPVHPEAQPWMLKGRAFHQALTEAIWSTSLLRSYLLLKDHGVEFAEEELGRLNHFCSMLESSMEQYRHILIHERGTPENNYTAWLNAALAGVYAAKGEETKLRGLLDGEGGFLHHLSIGVHPDQFEFEGSTYYHIFVLRAYLIVAEMAGRFGIDLLEAEGSEGQCLKGMFDVLAALAGDNGELPALHDGPFARIPFAREITEVFEIGVAAYGNKDYGPILLEAYRYLSGEPKRCGLEALLFGQGEEPTLPRHRPERPGIILPQSGFAVLRHPGNPLSVLADFGPHGGSHGHYDKLHVSLYHKEGPVTPELGMVPYGSALRKEWFAETASHNTVSIGGRSQAPHTGRLMKSEDRPTGSYLWLRSEEAYQGAVLDRHLIVAEDYILDWFHVELQEENDIDWWFHPVGMLELPGEERWESAEGVAGGQDGYPRVELLRVLRGGGRGNDGSPVKWRLALQNRRSSVTGCLMLAGGSELYEIRTPGTAEDPSRRASGLLHRSRGSSADIIALYRSGPIEGFVQSSQEAGRVEIRIDSTRGTQVYELLPDFGLKLV